jgi:hypothetical protein
MLSSDDVRRIAMSLPETAEKVAWDMPTFRVAGRMYITVPDDETSFAVRCPRHERGELIAAEPEKFWVPPHEAGTPWVRVRLAVLEGIDELRDILVDSWKQAAPPRLLDDFAGPEPGPDAGTDPGTR